MKQLEFSTGVQVEIPTAWNMALFCRAISLVRVKAGNMIEMDMLGPEECLGMTVCRSEPIALSVIYSLADRLVHRVSLAKLSTVDTAFQPIHSNQSYVS